MNIFALIISVLITSPDIYVEAAGPARCWQGRCIIRAQNGEVVQICQRFCNYKKQKCHSFCPTEPKKESK